MHRTTFLSTPSRASCTSSSTSGRDFKLNDHNGIQIVPSCRWVNAANQANRSTVMHATPPIQTRRARQKLLFSLAFVDFPLFQLFLSRSRNPLSPYRHLARTLADGFREEQWRGGGIVGNRDVEWDELMWVDITDELDLEALDELQSAHLSTVQRPPHVLSSAQLSNIVSLHRKF